MAHLAPLLVALPFALGLAPASDSPWPEYRGPNATGDAVGATLPLDWSEERNVRWKTAIHGRGWSSPVVLGARIWLTTATPQGEQLSVLALDLATGRVLVDRVVFEVAAPEKRNALNSYASPSPVVVDGRVFVHFGTYGTACLDAETAETLWERRDLRCDHMEGPGSSPFLNAGRLYMNVDGGDVQYIIALDAASGETQWKRERSIDLSSTAADRRKAYSTPVLGEVRTDEGISRELVSSAARATYGYDPVTGEELWRVQHPGYSMSSRPIVVGDMVVLSTGFDRPELWAIRLGGRGDVTETHVVWRNTRGVPSMPSPVVAGGLLFQASDRGMASCVELSSGETLWQERLGADVCASLLHTEGRVYYFDRDGKTTVVAPAREYKRLGEAHLDKGCMASPAVVEDALILRTETHLYRIEAPREGAR
ncbi:MAG: PQQ-binding-like beta-propeller repeat protein [Planctomycetota bacterium]